MQNEERTIYRVDAIGSREIQLINVSSQEEKKSVPKYKLPLGLEEGMLVGVNEFGLFELTE